MGSLILGDVTIHQTQTAPDPAPAAQPSSTAGAPTKRAGQLLSILLGLALGSAGITGIWTVVDALHRRAQPALEQPGQATPAQEPPAEMIRRITIEP